MWNLICSTVTISMKYVALTHFLIKSSKTNGEDKNDSSDDLEENDEEIDENEDENKIQAVRQINIMTQSHYISCPSTCLVVF